MGSEMCIRDRKKPSAEILSDSFDHNNGNELQCGQHYMIHIHMARGMLLCKRVPPDPTTEMAGFDCCV